LRILFLVGMLLSVPLAWRNHKKNRGDRGGGLKIATFVLLLQMTAWLVGADHAYEFTTELGLTCVAFLRAMAFAAVVFVLYMALEPLARRYWPHMLIGWARLLYLRRSDPLVWQHVLVGLAVGCLWALFFAMDWALVRAVGLPVTEPFLARQAADRLVGGRAAVAALLQSIVLALWQGLVFATLLALVRAVVRKPLVAVFLVGVLLLAVLVPRGANPITSLFFTGLGATAVGLWALTRFGLLAVIVAAAATMMLNAAPMRFDQQGWVGGQGPALLILVCGVALIAFRYARRQVAPQRTCV
jgi:hypothetical protein